MKYWHRISLKPEGRHTVELRHFLNMPEVYYVCRCKIVIWHLTKTLSSLDVDRYSVAYPRTLIIEGCHIELDVVGYPPRGNRRHCALYAGSSTYAGLIRGYMDVTLSRAHNMPEALCMPD